MAVHIVGFHLRKILDKGILQDFIIVAGLVGCFYIGEFYAVDLHFGVEEDFIAAHHSGIFIHRGFGGRKINKRPPLNDLIPLETIKFY